MDSSYRVDAMNFSLKMLCAVKVCCRSVELVVGKCEVKEEMMDEFSKDTMKQVQMLNLPLHAREVVESLIGTIVAELVNWYIKSSGFRPIWTPHGTVDGFRSAMAFIEDGNAGDNVQRFMFASVFCLKDSIFNIGKQLTSSDIVKIKKSKISSRYNADSMLIWTPLAKFWLDVYQGMFGTLIDSQFLPQPVAQAGFVAALTSLKYGTDFALRYFIYKVDSEIMLRRGIMSLTNRFCYKSIYGISPDMISLMLSKLHPVTQQREAHTFAVLLLLSLLEWPYQSFFLNAAEKLAQSLQRHEFWFVTQGILQRIVEDRRDWDYRALFLAFWKLGEFQRKKTPIKKYERRRAMVCIFMTRDEELINFFLREHTTLQKEKLLMDFGINFICDTLLFNKEYQMLRVFVKECGMHNEKLLVDFRKAFLTQIPRFPTLTRGRFYHPSWFSGWEFKEWKVVQYLFSAIVDKIIHEKRSASVTV